jgi:hypothetical protein
LKEEYGQKHQVGVMAQDIEKLGKRWSGLLDRFKVDGDKTEYLAVKDQKLVFPLIVYIQELEERVRKLEGK